MKKICICALLLAFETIDCRAATVVASVAGKPITDTDITTRTSLMSRQGNTSVDNRRQALQRIIDDSVKIGYAANFGAVPTDKDVDAELKRMQMDDLTESEREMARNAVRAEIAWQAIVARTIMPTIEVSNEDIKNEKVSLEREHGLPLELTLVRLVDVPNDIAKQLTKPTSCDNAMDMATRLGGVPQKFTAIQYELSPDVRDKIAGLGKLTWSTYDGGDIFLICDSKKTPEYKNLDAIIKQNAIYKQAMFIADQQLKQLRRRAVVIINDERYKL